MQSPFKLSSYLLFSRLKRNLLIVLTVVFTLIFLQLSYKVVSADTSEITPLATTPNGRYQIILHRSPAYSGPINIKSWVCDNRSPADCSAPVEYIPWKDTQGNTYQFINNILDLNLNGLNVPERIYHAQIAIPGSAYLNPMEINITKNADIPGNINTVSSVKSQTQQVTNSYLSANPIMTLPGFGGNTVNNIYNGSGSAENKVHQVWELTCGIEPAASANLEDISSWRSCAAAMSYIMMTYHAWKNETTKINQYAYGLIFQMDSLISTDSTPPLHGLAGLQYRLGNTSFTKNYINDFGMGVFSGLGWLKASAKISQPYCTTLEQPYDPGGTCKTIDLYARVKNVARKVIDGTNDFKSFRGDAQFWARSSAGRAVAAKLTGDSSLITSLTTEANDLISKEYGTNSDISSPVPFNMFGWSDNFQHVQVAFNVNNWSVPSIFQQRYLVWTRIFFGSYFDKTYPVANIGANSYIESAIRAAFPTAVIKTCGQSGGNFHVHSSGVVVGLRGELLSDALTTIGPPLNLYLANSAQPGLAQEVLDITARMLRTMSANLPNFEYEMCDPAPIGGNTPKSHLQIAMRTFAYLYYTYQGFSRAIFDDFNDPPLPLPTPTPPPCICTGSVTASITALPQCSEATYTVTATGITNCGYIRFPTWSDDTSPSNEGQDDINWYTPANIGGGSYRATINSTNHPAQGQPGGEPADETTIYTDVWVGVSGPEIYCGGDNVNRICASRATPTPAPSFTIAQLKTLLTNYLTNLDSQYKPVDGKVNLLDAGYVIKWIN